MPSDPLQAIYDMAGGHWQDFHFGSQDFKYRQAEGVVAATDGSVIKDEDEGICLGGGVAFQEGPHGLSDIYVRAYGRPSSFVAEGAAAAVLLSAVLTDVPLTILTDSANVMFAMQHCLRKDYCRDFSRHQERKLIQAIAAPLAARTAPTTWVKIKAHRSVPANKRADRLAASAPFKLDCVAKKFMR